MKIEIKNRWDGSVIFSHDVENNTVALTVKAALSASISLRGANLSGADLSGANLSGAYLVGAYLRGANLCNANLTPIRDDIWAVLSATPAEVPSLIAALKNGQIDGSAYTGDCCCLVGTIANARHCEYDEIDGLKPNAARPAERFFLGIAQGDTPETSQFSALAVQWAEEWLDRMHQAFGKGD